MHAPITRVAISLVAALAFVALSGCSASPDDYAGRVFDDTVTVQAPALPAPSVSLDAGFAPSASGSAGGSGSSAQRSSAATAVALAGLGSVVRVTSVAVSPGEPVRAGQEIAQLDGRALDANAAVARAGLSGARAQVAVLDDALDTVVSGRSTLATKRAQINSAAAQLASTRAKLATQLAQLKALLAKVEALSAGGGRPRVPPGTLPTGTLPPGATPPGATPPTGGLPDPAKLRAGIAKLSAALAKIDAGLGKVSAGRAKLAAASAKLSDARGQLTDLRRLARVGVTGAKLGVQVAEYQRGLSVVRSPADGIVVSVVSAGSVLAPGATIAEVRRDGPTRVTTWIAPETLQSVGTGTEAEVRADWLPGSVPLTGRVTSVSTRAEYPPTSFATDEIHLTRAVRIEMTLYDNAAQPALPPGTPVDVRFLGK